MNLSELKTLWEKEKEHYKRSEIGSGVQTFVWEMLRSPDLFNLSKGLKSTDDHKRKGEFLLEESTRSGQADAVIFMDSEVIIPVEVEKYEKAQAGEWQILKYRTAFDKKYGILTDGFEWRFYYGDIADHKHYKFTIDEIFSNPKRFRLFWDEYVKPQNYYLSFFEEVGQQKMELFDERKSVDAHREKFFQDVTDIIRKLKDKLLNAGYFRSFKDEQARDKKATEIAYSYLIQFILYKTLVDNAFDEFKDEFAKKESLIHQNLKKQSYNSVLMILEGMSQKISQNIYKPFHEEQEAIFEQVKDIVHSGEENLMNVAPFLDIFFFIRQYHFADVQNDIFGAIYESYLKELYEEQQLGQYFTDPAVVDFMLEEIGYTAEEIRNRGHKNISIVDPACGSGTFLYSAVREIVKAGDFSTEEGAKKIEDEVLQNVFGLDIAEFPLYLAEMSILMKMLPMIVSKKYNNPIDKKLKLFVTEDSVAEFVETLGSATEDGSNDQQKMPLGWQYGGFMRDKHDLDEMMQSLSEAVHGKRTIPRRRFDFVVGNPPYISYNECAKAGVKIFQLLKENNSGVNLNNIYGWNLHSVPTNRKKYSPKPNLYAFFIALGVALLKKNGRLCYIIPQTMLVNSDFDVLRYCLAKNTTLEKFFIFKSKMFIGRGLEQKRFIPTSSLIIVIHNQTPAADNVVDVCTYLNENDDINTCLVNMTARNPDAVLMQQVPQKKLLANLANWNFLGKEEGFLDLYEAYKANSDGMAVYFEHKMSEPKFGSRFYFDKGLVFPKDAIRDAEAKQKDEFALVKLKKLFYNAEVLERYVNEKSIRIPQGSQGLDVYRCRYKVIWSYMNWDQFYFCDKQIVIGYNFVIISSDNREELLYLLSILNSSVSKVIIHTLLKIANEDKLTLLLGIKQIKEHIRAPRITDQNKHFKNKVIKLTEQMLEMEKQTIADLVEPDTLMQHFNDVRVEGFNLVLKSGSKEVRAAIKRGAVKLVEKALDAHFGSQKLLPGERAIALAELKALPAFDKDGQMKIKEEIDELVFDLYGLTKTELQHFSTL